ncbi:MAG: serine/threonine-protein kinase [Polyangiaceae bacterium]
MGKPASLSDPRSLLGITLSGGYKTERLIDEGGLGIVLAARDPSGHEVAVKVLRPEAATEEMLSRVTREASILSKLNDRHVVPVLDVGHDLESDLVYLVLPLLSGVDVAELLGRGGVLAPKTAARIALQASTAMVAAHPVGVAFRDLRATKLFLETTSAGEVVVRVLGPGLRDLDVQAIDPAAPPSGLPRSATASRAGAASRSDRRADVFGLGAVLYQMLSGKAPQVMDRASSPPGASPISARLIAPIQDVAPWVDAPLALALEPSITADLQRRYPSAESFGEMLRAVIGADEKLTPAMLAPLDAEARAVIAARADHDADPLVGHSLGGRYKVVRLIGRGGMGGVYEAIGVDGRHIAAKVIFRSVAGQDDQHMRRFIREARAATAIDSPHVVRTFELGTDLKLGSPFIAMELLSGSDIAKLLQDRGPMLAPGIVRAFVQAARGLSAAHKAGIVHRDVKPANIFLHQPKDSADLLVKVCDFGVAKRSEEGAQHEITREGGVLGSPLYMSPEQAKTASHVDHRTDIWGLCISLYQALSGNPPWDPNASLAELLLAVCTQRVPPLAEVAPWVPAELAAAVHKGIAREPEDRWQSMDELIGALLPFTGGTEALRMDDLVPVPEAELENAPPIESYREGRGRNRTGRASRASISRAETLDRSTLHSPRAPDPPPRSRAAIYISAGLAALAIAGVLTLRPPASATGGSGFMTTPLHQATVRVPPSATTVLVNGQPRRVQRGAIPLEGEAGDGFLVLVKGPTGERSVRVILTKDGAAEPDHVDLPDPPPPEPAPSASDTTSTTDSSSASAPPSSSAPSTASSSTSTSRIPSVATARSNPPAVPGTSVPPTSSDSSATPPPTVKPVETW